MMNKPISVGSVGGVYVGWTDTVESEEVRKLHCFLDGVRGDRHRGWSRFSMVRDIDFIAKDQEVLNLRQVTVVSEEENVLIAHKLGIAKVSAQDLGANVLVSGINNFSQLPVGTMLKFSRGCYLMLTGDNVPCIVAGGQVQSSNSNTPGIDKEFAHVAMHMRGQTAIVYKAGVIKKNDQVDVLIPNHVRVGLDAWK